ncbi:MAG: response regulator transcription factor [Chitinophagaceae bacterium]|nr:response regulator transcription factor [Chitinophagaceae bacterium]
MKQRILVIDDSKAIGFLLQTILGKKYNVIAAPDGYTAMHWLSKKNLPDIMIASPQLPDMQNWELIEYLTGSGLYGTIPLIALSALSKVETAEKCRELGIEHYFQKPFNPVELEKCISKLIIGSIKDIGVASERLHLKVG